MFCDPGIGAVSGALCLADKKDAVGRSFSSYWDLEMKIRRSESLIHSVIGLTGAICAIRKHLYEELPENTILDDVLIPMRIAAKGYRIAYNSMAVAYDDAPIEYGRELKRKIRTLTGNFQLLTLMPELLSIRKNKLFFQFFSHKVTRLLAPLFIVALFVSNLCLWEGVYIYPLIGQAVFYGIAVAAFVVKGIGQKSSLFSIPLTFVMLNYAVFAGFMNFVRKRRDVWVR